MLKSSKGKIGEGEAKTVESVIKEGMRKLLIRVAKRGRKKMFLKREKKRVSTLFLFGKKKTCAKRKRRDEEAMEGRRDMEKTCPLQRKHFDQTFLKFDAWCESTRGLKKIAK